VKNISLGQARECINHAVDKAASEFGRPICVSVCDTYGYQVAFLRMDGAPIRSIAISQQKAHTATRMGMSTDAFLERLRTDKIDIGYFCDPLMTALPGGNLLTTSGGDFLGAVGVSGLKPVEDQVITESVAQMILNMG